MTRLWIPLTIALLCAHCGDDRTTDSGSGEFGIFLTRTDVPPSEMIALSHVEPADEPIIGLADIAAYIRENHAIVLTKSGRNKLDSLKVPVSGRSFLVYADGSPRYDGAFWTFISSASFDGPVIVLPAISDTVHIEIGYPGRIDGGSEDPRDDPEVMDALAAAGKLQ